jgi:tripartite-type tricarboxylate transporter receptor subunit TctC
VTSATRSSLVPQLPTVAELGVPGFEVTPWYCLLAPRGTPALVVETLARATEKALSNATVRQRLADLGAEPRVAGPQQLASYMAEQVNRWNQVAVKAGIKDQ